MSYAIKAGVTIEEGTAIYGYNCKNIANFIGYPKDAAYSIFWTDPIDDIWKGTKVVYKEGSPPISPEDGILVVDNQVRNQFKDKELIINNLKNDTIYYIRLFPYTQEDIYNINIQNIYKIIPKKYIYYYGFDIINEEPNPNSRVIYPAGVMNTLFLPVHFGSNGSAFQYNSWQLKAGDAFMPRPCVLNYNGIVSYYLQPNDYSKKIDNTPSNINRASCPGNAMMEWPKIYTKRWDENGIYHFRCSDIPLDEDYHCWCNYDKNNHEIDHFYTAIYLTSLVNGSYRSLSGQKPIYDQRGALDLDKAIAIGDRWSFDILGDRLLILDLLILLGKTTDLRQAFVSNKGDNYMRIKEKTLYGWMDQKGMFWSNDSDKGQNNLSARIFGMDCFFGYDRKISGCYSSGIASGTLYLKFFPGTIDGSRGRGFDSQGTNSIMIPYTGWHQGMIRKMECTKFGRMPSVLEGADSTEYECSRIDITAGIRGMYGNFRSIFSSNSNFSFTGLWDLYQRYSYFSALSYK